MGQTHHLTRQNQPQAMHTITRITVTIEATQTVAWPHYSGSTLRGAFGRALRRTACLTGQDKCAGCPLRSSCAYGVVFDPAAPAQPLHPSFRDGLPRFVVQPPALGACQLPAGQSQKFNLLFLPGTDTHHGLIEHILRSAVEKELFQPGLFKLLNTQVSQDPVPPNATQHPASASAPPTTDHITLRWLTPLRLQRLGKPVFKPQQLDAEALVRALLLRQLQWCQLSGQSVPDPQAQLAAASACTADTSLMQWHDMQRYSHTQKDKLPQGGLVGKITLKGPPNALQSLLPLLQLGEQLHIGKSTVMGLGRLRLGA
jgi:CRISPR/Cas system endoribonuclease Cas6 (RAMP superfamily)